jgi:hypothetical protein
MVPADFSFIFPFHFEPSLLFCHSFPVPQWREQNKARRYAETHPQSISPKEIRRAQRVEVCANWTGKPPMVMAMVTP